MNEYHELLWLTGPEHNLTLAYGSWRDLLTLAQQHGWTPAGTEAPHLYETGASGRLTRPYKTGNWDGNYLQIDGQYVTAPDAQALRAALEVARTVVGYDPFPHLPPYPDKETGLAHVLEFLDQGGFNLC
jgi:hypothetical protein